MSEPKSSILFLCTHNSARSQMAEGLMRAHLGDRFEVYSAGTEVTFVKKPAIEALSDAGIDISGHTSKTIDDLDVGEVDYVVTLCDEARETCPYFPARVQSIHRSFPDPSNMGDTPAERLGAFMRTRDDIRDWILDTFGEK